MKIGVTHKLFLVILLAVGLTVASSTLIILWSFNRGSINYINSVEKIETSRLTARLEEVYRTEQDWVFLLRDPAQWHRLVSASLSDEAPPPGETIPTGSASEKIGADIPFRLPRNLARDFEQRLFLLDADRKPLLTPVEVPADNMATALRYQGKVVGYLGLRPRTNNSDAFMQRFLNDHKPAFRVVVGVFVLLATALSLLLARWLVRPLIVLGQATQQLAAGSFTVRVPVTSHDELGQLANDFNSLALALEKSEQTRRQWVADISHELRTPLAILQGEIEALQDGIRQPTHDAIRSLHSEVLRIGRLVGDLYQLALSDVGALTYRKTELDMADVLVEAIDGQWSEFLSKKITLEPEISEKGVATVFGDPERLHQLFSNLLDNALKYTDAGGNLQISLRKLDGIVSIDFKDSAPGVSESEMEKLFDRLYRVESSRNRSTGGAGLGLAICRNIVEAHGGSITAQASPLGGLWISLELPGAGS